MGEYIPGVRIEHFDFLQFRNSKQHGEVADWLEKKVEALLKELRRSRPRSKEVKRILKDILKGNVPNQVLTYLRLDLFDLLSILKQRNPSQALLRETQQGTIEISRLWAQQIRQEVDNNLRERLSQNQDEDK